MLYLGVIMIEDVLDSWEVNLLVLILVIFFVGFLFLIVGVLLKLLRMIDMKEWFIVLYMM